LRYGHEFIKPPVFDFTHVPKDAIFHYDGDLNVDTTQPVFQNYNKKIGLINVTDYHRPEGPFMRKSVVVNVLLRKWLRENNTTWQIAPLDWYKETTAEKLFVFNYGYLEVLHKYKPMITAPYYKWENRYRTIFYTANAAANLSQRHQFIVIHVPEALKGKTILDKYQDKEVSVQMLNVFGDPEQGNFMQLVFWRWIGLTYRHKSLLSVIEPKNYKKINFVFMGLAGTPCLINMAWLNSFIEGQQNETYFSNVRQFNPTFLQKAFIKFFIALNGLEYSEDMDTNDLDQAANQAQINYEDERDYEDLVSDEENEVDEETKGTGFRPPPTHDNSEDEEPEVIDAYFSPTELDEDVEKNVKKVNNINDNPNRTARIQNQKQEDPDKAPESYKSLVQSFIQEVERDISLLDKISIAQEVEVLRAMPGKDRLDEASAQLDELAPVLEEFDHLPSPEEVLKKAIPPEDFKEVLKVQLDRNATKNNITAADYRKALEKIESFNNSLDPYGSKQKRIEASTIKPEELLITPEDKKLKDLDLPDPSMYESSLNNFNKKYIRHVLKKDILKSIDAIQTAGVIVNKHSIERVDTVIGSHENHTLEIKPIKGPSSTIHFSIPVINEDGTYVVSGSKYASRLQRLDKKKLCQVTIGIW
jgi:hypothetical protein